jgi:hypothetical protein
VKQCEIPGPKAQIILQCPDLVGRVALRPDAPRSARRATIEIGTLPIILQKAEAGGRRAEIRGQKPKERTLFLNFISFLPNF